LGFHRFPVFSSADSNWEYIGSSPAKWARLQ
jgi:hypothetical protein